MSEKFYKTIGNNIVLLRKKRGLTQTKLAEKIGVSSRVLCSYEKGTYHMNAETLDKIASILEVSVTEILGKTPPKEDNRTIDAKLLQKFYRLQELPNTKKKAVNQIIDALLEDSAVTK